MSDSARTTHSVKRIARLAWMSLRDPFETARSGPDLTWVETVGFLVTVSFFSGAVHGAIQGRAVDALIGALALPLLTLGSSFGFAFFLRVYSSALADVRPAWLRIQSLFATASVPFLVAHALAGALPLLDLVGFVASALLVAVGLHERLGAPRKVALRLVAAAAIAFFVVWSFIQFRSVGGIDAPDRRRSLDQLERELHERSATKVENPQSP